MEDSIFCVKQSLSDPVFLAENKTVFMLFYAIAWGIVANVQGRWKAFHWPAIHRVPKARNRVLLSFLILNVLPFFFFGYALFALTKSGQTTSQRPLVAISELVIQSMLPALANFGFYRVWLGLIEWRPKVFYQTNAAHLPEEFRHVEPTIRTSITDKKSETPILYIGPHTAGPNLFWGMIYFLIALIAPWISL